MGCVYVKSFGWSWGFVVDVRNEIMCLGKCLVGYFFVYVYSCWVGCLGFYSFCGLCIGYFGYFFVWLLVRWFVGFGSCSIVIVRMNCIVVVVCFVLSCCFDYRIGYRYWW